MKAAKIIRGLVGLAIVVTILTMGTVVWSADGTWASAVDGNWDTAGNWQSSVKPDNGHANLTAGGASYTVTYDSTQPAISNMVVQNSAGNQTTLNLSAPLTHVGGAITLSTGADVQVTNGAAWTYEGTLPGASDKLLDIGNGATLEVCGGVVQFTNVQRAVASAWNAPTFQIGNASTGTLRVTSGQFNGYTETASANDKHEMYVGNGVGGDGTLEIGEGSTVTLGRANGDKVLYVGREGGRGKAVIEGDLVFTNNAEPRIGTVISVVHGGYGEMIVTNAGRLIMGPGGDFGKPRVGIDGNCYGVLRLSGTNDMTAGLYNGWAALYAGQCQGLNGTSTGLVELTSGSIKVWGDVQIGVAQGAGKAAIGTLNISGGMATFRTAYNTYIGRAGDAGDAEGTLNLEGGALLISGGGNYGAVAYPGYTVSGFIVGMIGRPYLDDTQPSTHATGTLNLSDGAITNYCQLVIGCNGATGVVVQTGGAYVHVPWATDTANMMTLIGYSYGSGGRGGHGAYTMTGGTFTSPRRVFVGGVPTSVHSWAIAGSGGALTVTGGTFTCSSDVYVGANGTGTLTLGSTGTVHAANVVLDNAPSSTLRFEIGPLGAGQLQVDNAITIAAGSTLEVDASAMPSPPSAVTYTLVNCTSRSADFSTVTVTPNATDTVVVDQTTDQNITVTITPPAKGTVISVQ